VGNDHLGGSGDLKALSLGGRGSGAVLRLGVDRDGAAIDHHGVEWLALDSVVWVMTR
jgi:hypothetical protein